jgi:hypothetical protein
MTNDQLIQKMDIYYVQALLAPSWQGEAANNSEVIILQNELNKREILQAIQDGKK